MSDAELEIMHGALGSVGAAQLLLGLLAEAELDSEAGVLVARAQDALDDAIERLRILQATAEERKTKGAGEP